MPTYIALLNLTDQGVKNIKSAPQRVQNARDAIEKAGGKMPSFYLTMGEYDYVAIVEAPSDEAYTTIMLAISGLGNVRSTTLKAFTEEEMTGIIGGLP